MTILASDSYFNEVCRISTNAQRLSPAQVRDYAASLTADALQFTGRCVDQVGEFLRDEVQPAIGDYVQEENVSATLDV